jgi:hypothetical protein
MYFPAAVLGRLATAEPESTKGSLEAGWKFGTDVLCVSTVVLSSPVRSVIPAKESSRRVFVWVGGLDDATQFGC